VEVGSGILRKSDDFVRLLVRGGERLVRHLETCTRASTNVMRRAGVTGEEKPASPAARDCKKRWKK
jgi:hypothetical protein